MFLRWLHEYKGLSISTCQQYNYWVLKYKNIRNIEKLLWSIESNSKKKIVYSALKHWSEYTNKTWDIKINFKNYNPPIIEYINEEDVEQIKDNYIHDSFEISTRNKTMALFCFYHGLRISELLNIKKEDINGEVLSVVGKGSKIRNIPLDLNRFNIYLEKIKKGYLFNINRKKISYSGAIQILEDIKVKCGLNKKITWHSFRHGYAMRLLRHDIDLYSISKLLGHSQINTTEIYLHFDLKNEIEKLKDNNVLL